MGDTFRKVPGICAIEGYNGCNMRVYNTKAVETARELNLPFTGGSDAHHPEEVGLCFTEFEDAVTRENLVYLLKAGNYQGVDNRRITRVLGEGDN